MVKLVGTGKSYIMLKNLSRQKVYLVRENKKQIFNTLEADRGKIADLLQEEIAQLIAIAKMQLPIENYSKANACLKTAVQKLRQLSFELKPQILELFGLAVALEQLLNEYFGLTVKLKDFPNNMDKMIEAAIFRLIQQILSNIPATQFSDFTLNIKRVNSFIQVKVCFVTQPSANLFTDASFKHKLSEIVQPVLFLFNGDQHLKFYPNQQYVEFYMRLDESVVG